MALNSMLNLKTTVGLTKRVCPTLVQSVKYSWEPKEVETHTGQVSRNDIVQWPCERVVSECVLTFYLLVVEMGKGGLPFGAFHRQRETSQ